MLPPGLQTPREVTLYYDSVYEALVDSGQAVPFLYPWAGIGAFLIIGYLLVDHRRSPTLRWLRYPSFALMCAFEIWVIKTNKARHPAAALGVGLLSAWGILWVSTLMVVNDCQADFSRLERSTRKEEADRKEPVIIGSTSNGTLSPSKTSTPKLDAEQPAKGKTSDTIEWQQCPTKLRARLDWVADVFCSFRGVGWTFQTTTVPPLPKSMEAKLHGSVDSTDSEEVTMSKTGIRRFSNRTALLKDTLIQLSIGYLALDVIKVLMHHDPYFWGYTDAASPSYLPMAVMKSYSLVRAYRLLIGLAAMYTALWQIYKLGPLFFCGIVGPEWIGVRGEAWMNPPDMFGSFNCVLDNGLAGWWGGWWHQVFRVAFEAHSTWLLKRLKIEKTSETGKTVGLLVSFFLSACLHACGSYTLLGDTRPLKGPARFFLLQPFGIVAQMLLTSQLYKFGILDKSPKWLRQTTNFVFVHTWLFFTAPLLIDDFARGGTFLFQPLPISPLRGFGLGAKDDTWFCWRDGVAHWRSGKRWWDTGIAL